MAVVWEYQTVVVVPGIDDTGWEEKLNAAGQDGWEAVGVVPLRASYENYYTHALKSMSNVRFAVLLKRPR
ncbi:MULTISPECIES: hypothetical protein [unclassified Streptomyces]|uniref:hypothetical protein n=1 Tax=unclassified Streptomyces TaxID=2593676 RepID=UPI00336A3136